MATDVFCDEKIRSEQAYFESKYMFVLYDIAPVLPGHSLIIPKRHVMSITELTLEEVEDLFSTLKKVVPVLIKVYGDESESYDLIMQSGPYSGMTVKHAHMHVLPRLKVDRYNKEGKDPYGDLARLGKMSPAAHKAEIEKLKKLF